MKAIQPNLVQTLENNPAFIHGGPFANIAHGCNSVMATRTALKLADYVVTEAGFGADLGAEKFFDIKCRAAGLKPSAAVIVATIRALKMHGGVAKDALGKPNVEALKKGCANLGRHIDNVKQFGVPVVVAINHFTSDTAEEIAAVQEFARSHGVEAILCEHWAKGSEGTEELAQAVVRLCESGAAQFAPLYEDELPLWEKINADRHAHLPRRGGGRRQEDPRPAARMGQGRLQPLPRLHGEDAIFLLHRPESARRADPPRRADPRGAAFRRRRLRRGDLRGDHDHARPAEGAGGGDDPARRGRAGGGAVLWRAYVPQRNGSQRARHWPSDDVSHGNLT